MEDKKMLREHLYKHGAMLIEKVHKMFESGELTPAQMGFAADVLKDVAKMDKALSAACYYDSERSGGSDKTY